MATNFIKSLMDFIFSNSYIFDKVRSIIHNDYKNEKKIISENFERNKNTLDFGCGAGQFSILFNPSKYYGVDTSTKYIKFCKLNRKGNFFLIKHGLPYNFNKKFFNQILVSAVIHHIDDNKIGLIAKGLNRILKSNGRLMIVDHFTKKNQKNIFCKFLINLDRGKDFRDSDNVINLFSRYFKFKGMKSFNNGPYKDYALILIKK